VRRKTERDNRAGKKGEFGLFGQGQAVAVALIPLAISSTSSRSSQNRTLAVRRCSI
jgi:hypothetical protein